MKKSLFLIIIALFGCTQAFGETAFIKALETCSNYSQEGSIPYNNEVYNLKITLQKGKGDSCIYKEKIYQDIGYEELNCNFTKNQLQFVANSMREYSNLFKNELAKNRIFEAKLTSNGVVFQKYLIEPNICKITHFKK